MSTQTSSQVTTQLFVGIRITPDVGMAMKQSKEWAQDQISPPSEGIALKKKRYEGKEYLGVDFPSGEVSLQQLNDCEGKVRAQVAVYCPKLNSTAIRVYIFSQVLIH